MEDNKTFGRPVSILQGTTRDKIIEYLKENTLGTTQDFIEASGDNDNNVRRAIRFLDSKNIIISNGKRESGGVGNPAKLWQLV